MKCPLCGTWSRVLDTRGVKRVRECANLHRFETREAVVKVKTGPLDKTARNTAIARDPRPAQVIATEYGLTPNTVRHLKRTLSI